MSTKRTKERDPTRARQHGRPTPSGAIGLLALALLSASTPADAQQAQTATGWREHYERARDELVHERYAEAAAHFDELAATAATPVERKLALELAAVARAGLERETAQPSLRTPDELAILYTTAVFYGLGTSGWLALQIQPQTFGGALLPFAVLTPAAVGIVAVADGYRPLRHGIPHAIAAGLYLGFGEGLWLVGYQHAYAAHHADTESWHAERVSTALWVGSTVGAGVGGLIGALRRPTPGRVSLTASAAIWGGVLSAFAASAIAPEDRQRAQAAYLVGGIGYNVGLVTALLVGPEVAPSVARVRFLDLGGLGGALLFAGGSALITQQFGSRETLGAAAIGGALGLGLAFWATSDMPADHSHDALPPAIGSRDTGFAGLRPVLAPLPDGFTAGVIGAL